jgi:hypothetical protein
MNQPG